MNFKIQVNKKSNTVEIDLNKFFNDPQYRKTNSWIVFRPEFTEAILKSNNIVIYEDAHRHQEIKYRVIVNLFVHSLNFCTMYMAGFNNGAVAFCLILSGSFLALSLTQIESEFSQYKSAIQFTTMNVIDIEKENTPKQSYVRNDMTYAKHYLSKINILPLFKVEDSLAL